jgi:hypothetical protein
MVKTVKTRRVNRGNDSLQNFNDNDSSNTNTNNGFRPCPDSVFIRSPRPPNIDLKAIKGVLTFAVCVNILTMPDHSLY